LTGQALVEEFCDATDRYRLYSSTKKNWLASPAPVVYVNAVEVTSGFVINYGGGCVEFDPPLDSDDAVTVDVTCTKAEAKSVIPYVVATGSADTYAVTLSPVPTAYYEGMAFAMKINVDNTGASTVNVNSLGAKTIKRPNLSDVTAASLKANSIYTVRYNGTNFVLQGEGGGGGDAAVTDVVAGKTFTNDSGEQTGTLADWGATKLADDSWTDGAGQLNFLMNTIGALTSLYSGYAQMYMVDADFISANIRAGVTIFGVTGNSNVVNTSSGDAVASNLLSGKKAWVDGVEITGSVPLKGNNPSAGYEIYIGVSASGGNAYLKAPAGIYEADTWIKYTANTNLVAANIKSGVAIMGVTGTYSQPAIQSIQRGTTLPTSAAEYDITISSVDTTKCFVRFSQHAAGAYGMRGYLYNSTTLRVIQPDTSGWETVVWEVVEFTSDSVASYQRGNASVNTRNISSKAVTVTSITNYTKVLVFLTSSSTASSPARWLYGRMTSATVLTIYVDNPGDSNNYTSFEWILLEMNY